MMGAVETTRGGRYILPSLRLMSSDLVIDEIDDFNSKDLIAIARLVHLAGLCGRNVAISSATIPPDLAEGLYRSYQAGLKSYNSFFTGKNSVLLCFVMSSGQMWNRWTAGMIRLIERFTIDLSVNEWKIWGKNR